MKRIRATAFATMAAMWALAPAGAGAASGTRTSSFAYSGSGFLIQEVIEPNTSSLRLETDYGYDAFGHKTVVVVSGVDIASRSSSATYDSRGQFATQQTNELGQSESWQYDVRFGKPTSHTGPNGLTTTWQYDSFGRKTLEIRPDGTRTTWAYTICTPSAGCAAGAAYRILMTPQDANGNQNGPLTSVAFDVLDREIYRFTQGFDGSWITLQTQYDSFGRVSAKSRPYFWGGTAQLTTFTYDAIGRVVTEHLPNNTTNQHAYHALVTTDTNVNGQIRTVTKNSQGKVVSIIDAANQTIRFTYDPFGNLLTTTDAAGNVVSNTYDGRGRKVVSNDPDLGAWTYGYNTLGQVISQTDAKGQSSTFSYDLVGRMTQRVEADMTSAWTYDTAAHGIGKLASARITAGAGAGYQRAYSYDGLSRPYNVAFTINGNTNNFAANYDSNGRLFHVTYGSGLEVRYNYNQLGYPTQLSNQATNQLYWQANARDAEQHLTQEVAGNNVVTSRTFDPATGRLLTVVAGTGNAVANFTYGYDALGNVTSRSDGNESLSETFTYDSLNRLISSTTSQNPTPLVKTFSYNAIGNLLSKSDVGNYAYPAAGQSRPHAVSSISGGLINTAFTYDANGNETSGLGRTIGYTSYNKPNSITQGALTLTFTHDFDHQRYKQVAPEAITYYGDAFGVHEEFVGSGSAWTWNDYLMVGGVIIGVRSQHPDSSVSVRYFHKDHLGSVAVITDENGAVVERLSYDAWGKRRFPTGADDPAGSLNNASQTSRGFTGEEMLGDVALVHLNGRVYDPYVGRMLSADPFVPDPTDGQAWNRYSYVINNPLTFTDTNGYCFLGLCNLFHSIGTFVNRVFNGVQKFLQRNPLIGTIINIASAAIGFLTCGPVCAAEASVISSAAVAGITTGSFEAALKAGFISAATAIAFNFVGDITSQMSGAVLGLDGSHGTFIPFSEGHIANIFGHALVGCGAALASGNRCGQGALTAGLTSFVGPWINGQAFSIRSVVANAVIGGLASVAGGGKFANGALTAAFGYLFNAAGDRFKTPDEAAYDVLSSINPQSIRENAEYAGTIRKDPSTGEYYATEPNRGDETSAKVCCSAANNDVGLYHTHGDYSWQDPRTGVITRTSNPALDNLQSDRFSAQDINIIHSLSTQIPAFTGYLGTPSGTFLRYTPYRDPPTGSIFGPR